jgi:hypothetical protein
LAVAKKTKKPRVVPPRGPATNLRKAGAHEDKKRKAARATDQKAAEELTALGAWAFDEE